MKKLSLCLMLCFLFLGNLAAQWSVGGKVGVDWSKMTYPIDGMDAHFKAGATLGAVANYQLNDWLDLQGELLYSQHNYKDDLVVDLEGGSLSEMLKVKAHYIDVPLLVKFYPLKHDSGFNLEAGLQPGIFLAQSAKVDNVDEEISAGDRNPVNCALLVGASFHAPKNWFIDLRYAFGLTNVAKGGDGFKIQSLQLSLGYFFWL